MTCLCFFKAFSFGLLLTSWALENVSSTGLPLDSCHFLEGSYSFRSAAVVVIFSLKYFSFYVYEYFVYVYVCVPHVCLVSLEVRRGHQIPEN